MPRYVILIFLVGITFLSNVRNVWYFIRMTCIGYVTLCCRLDYLEKPGCEVSLKVLGYCVTVKDAKEMK